MTKTGRTKIYKHQTANTLYLTIPAGMASDSAFPFKEGQKVMLVFDNDCLHVFPDPEAVRKVDEEKDQK